MYATILSLFLLHTLTITTSKMTLINHGLHKLRNTILMGVIFKEKKLHKLYNMVKDKFKTYHNKTIVIAADSYFKYNELSEDDKIIIETIISLCY